MNTSFSRLKRLGVSAGMLVLGVGLLACPTLASPTPASPGDGACPNRRKFDHIGNFNFKVEIEGANGGYFMALDVGGARGVAPDKAASTLKSGAARIVLHGGKGPGLARLANFRGEVVIEAVNAEGRSVSSTRLGGCSARLEGENVTFSGCTPG